MSRHFLSRSEKCKIVIRKTLCDLVKPVRSLLTLNPRFRHGSRPEIGEDVTKVEKKHDKEIILTEYQVKVQYQYDQRYSLFG